MRKVLSICLAVFAIAAVKVSSPAFAAGFESRFMQTCKADGDDLATCKCHYKKLKKPKTMAEQDLVINVVKQNDAKVVPLIQEVGQFRAMTIINSLTRGLTACFNVSN